MKKYLVFLLCFFPVTGVFAQKYWDGSRPDHRFTFGVRTGVNFSKQYNMEDGADNDFRTGFHVGITADVNFVRSFSINTGVLYTQKGYKSDYSDYRGSVKKTNSAAYIEIPVLASYRVELSDAACFQLNLGPYIAFGVGGKLDVVNTFQNGDSYDIDCFDDYDGMKKFDAGVSVGAAVVFSNIYMGASYERSFMNVSNTNDKFQNGNIVITLGYNF